MPTLTVSQDKISSIGTVSRIVIECTVMAGVFYLSNHLPDSSVRPTQIIQAFAAARGVRSQSDDKQAHPLQLNGKRRTLRRAKAREPYLMVLARPHVA